MVNGRDGFTRGASPRSALPAGRFQEAPQSDSVHRITDPWHRWLISVREMAYALLYAPDTPAPRIDVYGPVLAPDETALMTACMRPPMNSSQRFKMPLYSAGL